MEIVSPVFNTKSVHAVVVSLKTAAFTVLQFTKSIYDKLQLFTQFLMNEQLDKLQINLMTDASEVLQFTIGVK